MGDENSGMDEYPFIPEDGTGAGMNAPEDFLEYASSVLTDLPDQPDLPDPPLEGSAAPAADDMSHIAGTSQTVSYEEQAAEIDRKQAELEEQDRKLLQALDEVLEKRSRKMQYEERQQRSRPRESSAVRIAKGAVKKGVGFVSLGLILVFMGIVIIVCLFSPKPAFLIPLKLSPICAILVGLEILINQVVTHGNFKLNIPSLVVSAALVVGCCVMCTALNETYNQQKELYNNRSIAAEIYDRSYNNLRNAADIASLKVDVDLNSDSTGKYKGVEALTISDIVNIEVELGGEIVSPRDFTRECKKIMDSYRIMEIKVTNFSFINESELYSFKLDVEGQYVQDYPEERLVELVNYVYYDKYGFPEDIEDLVEENPNENKSE